VRAVTTSLASTHSASQFVPFRTTPRSRIDAHGFNRNLFFGQPDSDGPGPQAYINDLDPRIELAAHFHKVDQFQVFFGAPGATYKHRPIPRVLLHYTDAYSTYGPFSSGEKTRLKYATLRAQSSNFGGIMPGAEADLIRRGRLRNLTVEVPLTTAEPGDPAVFRNILERHADGLQAFTVTMGAAEKVSIPETDRTSGRFFCLLSGALDVDGQEVEARSLGWAPRNDTAVDVTAGPSGCCLLVMDFPSPSTPETIAAGAPGNANY
jgi:hypothetical protein